LILLLLPYFYRLVATTRSSYDYRIHTEDRHCFALLRTTTNRLEHSLFLHFPIAFPPPNAPVAIESLTISRPFDKNQSAATKETLSRDQPQIAIWADIVLMPSYSLSSPSLQKMDNSRMYGQRKGIQMSNILGDPFALATLSISTVRLFPAPQYYSILTHLRSLPGSSLSLPALLVEYNKTAMTILLRTTLFRHLSGGAAFTAYA
jgi:hypothetical protein